METAVIIVAAGRGSRANGVGDGLPKQYRSIGGIPILQRSLATFAGHGAVGAIVPVIHGGDRALFRNAVSPVADRVAEPVTGGATRQQSVLAGLKAIAPETPRNILIHDAARPFLSGALIDRVIAGLRRSAGAIPTLPVTETLKRGANGMIAGTVDRAGLWAAQTPQGFHFSVILAAHEAAEKAGKFDFTDDASIAEWHGIGVALVEGDAANVKLTTPGDFALAEQRFAGGETRIGQGYDVHAFAEGDHVMLCGMKIPHGMALAGHSDADVGLHAMTDALLGAIGDGDIGTHFPPSDERWRGAASDIFLRDAARRIAERGGHIVNLDLTLICETPKIGPHAAAMRATVAAILDIAPERISIKATTSERLGFTGRGEGIAAMASASVRLP